LWTKMRTRVGTSGYSFQDWRGTFYPEDLPKGEMLPYYARHFDIVEINSTYYRIPSPYTFRSMLRKVPEGFGFTAKVPKEWTHEGKGEEVAKPFGEAIAPLLESGTLLGLLAQFPWRFRNTPENRDYIRRSREWAGDVPLFVEFRHISWLKPEVLDLLKEEGIGFVSVDEPRLRGLLPSEFHLTTDIGYVRLHGRNAEKWWSGGAERYDYLYSEEELREWAEEVRRRREKMRECWVFFNNCHRGQAAQNALQMKMLLEA